jgi:ligand-binding sensor domain-containing protein
MEGLIDDTVQQILEDANGCLWLGCNRGICRVSKQRLDDLAALTGPKVKIVLSQICEPPRSVPE